MSLLSRHCAAVINDHSNNMVLNRAACDLPCLREMTRPAIFQGASPFFLLWGVLLLAFSKRRSVSIRRKGHRLLGALGD